MRNVSNLAAGIVQERRQNSQGDIAVWRTGSGPGALFIHGWPLTGLHWRDSMRDLGEIRSCISPDLMGLGDTDVPADADLSPEAQARMLLELMADYGFEQFDVVANDSGTAIAQIMMATQPTRVRSALLTNGDVHTNSPPAALEPALEAARLGQLEHVFRRHLDEPGFASSEAGLGPLWFCDPEHLAPELMHHYFDCFLASPRRIKQFQDYGLAFSPNPLIALRSHLRAYPGKVAILWGDSDIIFPLEWAYWLDGLFPAAQGVSRVEGGKLFFTEEKPHLVIEAARRLWL